MLNNKAERKFEDWIGITIIDNINYLVKKRSQFFRVGFNLIHYFINSSYLPFREALLNFID